MKKIPALIVLAALAVAAPVFSAQNGPEFLKVYMPDGRSITAELAATEAQRARGLMGRPRIGPDQGMLFVFDTEGIHSFWMKNTLVALDMVWLDRDHRIVHIAADVQPCPRDPCPSTTPARPGLYVLELKAGIAAEFKLKLFDRLDFALPRR
ncbi:MAG: DUF192 domain-containing protein [Candidatus Aminicenantes bacterium]|nr:DUF192 domain-containing protein [Candidatus Aminicenantes bacterium]